MRRGEGHRPLLARKADGPRRAVQGLGSHPNVPIEGAANDDDRIAGAMAPKGAGAEALLLLLPTGKAGGASAAGGVLAGGEVGAAPSAVRRNT